ncbi:hypothetical protein DNU06_07385 [Putridiphycobacter roseus]|uniref:Murein L,D-transpeptidase catalytic domain family protein n=1 Tax=Putridiphycobacter roseus TaxID=2219161 RepID=A0A2W1N1H1_9FLAO|nr:murein L,D-transpeptidase catalytic domain family protein [Putridiphycobacter roseus]PZE17644.1 hypothetical protein DNU06_07385 [Putridiphycobacter roseus]
MENTYIWLMIARNKKKSFLFVSIFFLSFCGFSNSNGGSLFNEKVASLSNDTVYVKAKKDFLNFTHGLYNTLGDTTLSYTAFEYAAKGYFNLLRKRKVSKERFFTVIDFEKPSTEERLFIIDICYNRIIYKSIVSHGKNSGGLYANKFSNTNASHQSSIGFYVTTSTYHSSKYDLALRLDGVEYSNSNASSRGVVMHGAEYATYEFLNRNGMLGRSYGCPAMPYKNFDKVVDWIKHGSCLFIYYPDNYYLKRSRLLNSRDYLAFFV